MVDTSEFLVESPPKPARKPRRRPVSTRERGVDVACRNGLFVMPRDAFNNTPMVVAICQFSVKLYNTIADLKIMKQSLKSAMEGTEGNIRRLMQCMCTWINKLIRGLIESGHAYKAHILKVEQGVPVNEPTDWVRG